MASVEIDGGVELRKAMKKFAPDLAANLEKEMNDALYPIVRRARGFVPATAPLSRWEIYSREKKGRFPWYNAMEIPWIQVDAYAASLSYSVFSSILLVYEVAH